MYPTPPQLTAPDRFAAWAHLLGQAGPVIAGHRGDPFHHLENTVPSLMAAASLGVAVELDVRITGDGVCVVFHDADLVRLAARPTTIASLPWCELRSIQLVHPKHPTLRGTIPCLDTVVEMLPRYIPMLVEIKCDQGPSQAATAVAAAMAVLSRRDAGSFAVMSFNPFVVLQLRQSYPHVLRGYLYETYAEVTLPAWQKWMLRQRVLGFWMRPHFWGPHVSLVTSEQVARDRRRGQATVVWTADSQAERMRVISAHADILITNDPATARQKP